MTFKTTLAVIALTFAPSIALAVGCSGGKTETTASSCAEGSAWNETRMACVPTPTT